MSALAAFIDALPIAISMIMVTAPMISVPLVLVTRPERGPHHGFMLGWVLGLAAVGAAAIPLSNLSAPEQGPPAPWVIWLRLILGLALIGLAAKKWQDRKSEDKEPAWMNSLETMGARTSFGWGVALATLNPKNSVIAAAGALTVAEATPILTAQAAAYAGFIMVASLGLLAPVIMTLLLGQRASAPLARVRDGMKRHGNSILAVVLFILGMIVTWKAIGDL